MTTTWVYSCGCEDIEHTRGASEVVSLDRPCVHCRRERVGQTIDFVRFGQAPKVSRNHADGTDEAGVSVYEVIDGRVCFVGRYFDFTDRPAFRGQGEIVGFGSDGEPLVRVVSIEPITRDAVELLRS